MEKQKTTLLIIDGIINLLLGGGSKGVRGLGITGAIVINFCGAGALLGWLLLTPMELPVPGRILLWSIVVVVLLVGIVELATRPWQDKRALVE